MDERVLTEHSGTPDAEDTDTFPTVAAARAPGDSAAAPAGRAESAVTAAPAHTVPAHTVPAHTVPAPTGPAAAAASRSRWTQVPYAIAVAGMIAGLAWTWQGTAHVRAGMVTVAAVLLAAAVGRLVLPERRAGMLATRHRLLDVVTMLGLGVSVLVLAIVLPRT